MRLFLSAIFCLLLTGCEDTNLNTHYQPSQKSILLDEISNKAFHQLKEEKNLYPIVCTGRMMDQITLIHWGFFYYKEIDVEEARKLLINTGDQFLRAFNTDERIRPYLATFPLTQKNMEIRIFLKKPDGSELEPEKLHVISMMEGTLNYKIGRLGTEYLKKIHTETYEEAKARLDAQYSARN